MSIYKLLQLGPCGVWSGAHLLVRMGGTRL